MIKSSGPKMHNTPWLPALKSTTISAQWTGDVEAILGLDEFRDETVESEDVDSEPDPLTFEQFEQQCYDELMRIHREALVRPMTEADHALTKSIVKEWKQKQSEHDNQSTA